MSLVERGHDPQLRMRGFDGWGAPPLEAASTPTGADPVRKTPLARVRAAAKIRHVPAGRPSLLTPALVDELAERVAAGEPLTSAARNAGASPRSLRRWRQAGRRLLDELPLEAQLELALERTPKAAEFDWRATAAWLEATRPELYALD
jgi:hypothetical protein